MMTVGALTKLDPGKAVVREYLLRIVADVALRYDIDGFVMDDYFYPEGIATEDAATFSAENRGFTDLGDWRRDNVNILIRSIRDTLYAIKPWIKFGMSPAGIWKNGVPPGVTGWDPYSAIYCDAVAWLQGKYIDCISPQLYRGFGGNQDYALLEPWWGAQLNGRLYWPSLPVHRIGEPSFGATDIARMIRFNRSTGNTQGYVLLNASKILDNRGGIVDTLRSDLNRWPALLPRIPWKDSIAPHPPSGLRYAPLAGTTTPVLQWDLPLTASDGDSASWYAVYRFDHRPAASELNDVQHLLAVEGCRYCLVSKFAPLAGPMYFTVTALDRNFNESDTSEVLMIRALPPPTPLLASPQDSATAMPESLRISWHPAASAVRYHLQVGADPGFGSGLLVNDSTMIDTARVVANPAGMTTYYWRVRAGNLAGFGNYAEPYSYTTGTPGPVVLVYPPAATPGIPNSLTFVWKKAPGATSYRVQIALYSNFTMMVKDTMFLPDTSLAVKGLALNTIHHWRAKGMNQLGSGLWSAANNFRTSVTGIETCDGPLPSVFELSQNFPNPFNPSTAIRYALPERSHVQVTVFNTLGQPVAVLQEGWQEAGFHETQFDASRLASGVYLYRLQAGDFVQTKKLLLVW
jgi:hypothetical protein